MRAEASVGLQGTSEFGVLPKSSSVGEQLDSLLLAVELSTTEQVAVGNERPSTSVAVLILSKLAIPGEEKAKLELSA